jgi:hypothetical protein
MHRLISLAATMLAVTSFGADAKMTADEAQKLGTTLTGVGAEKAANSDGTIPEYTGGSTTAPAGYKAGSGSRVDPFAEEKPLYSIDAKNVAQYESKLSEGVKAMLKKYPGYRLDVYPTHRTVSVPQSVLDKTRSVAQAAATADDGRSLVNAHAAIPFPVPHDGYEAMWNHLVHYQTACLQAKYSAWFVEPNGHANMSSAVEGWLQTPYWLDNSKDSNVYLMLRVTYQGPARRAGEALMFVDPVDYAHTGRRAYQYLPGQRRVKLAPDLAFDTPNATTAGASTFDEVYLFNGSMERFDFKLMGKKEIYVPYNDYRAVYQSTSDQLFKQNFLSPDRVRWELHRVWVVEAKLRDGKRHIFSRRTFYLDEDSWVALLSDEYDGRGQLFRAGSALMAPMYDVKGNPAADTHVHYDLTSGGYGINIWPGTEGWLREQACKSDAAWAPDALAAAGVR